MKPDYKTNDPKGWCGDPKRGAALGRGTIHDAPRDFSGVVTLRRVRLDEGGYDDLGTYWGAGDPLYWYANEDGTIDACTRAKGRDDAKRKVSAHYPRAQFDKAEDRQEIVDAIGWMLWAEAWIQFAEENGQITHGGDLSGLVPAVPAEVQACAVKLAEAIERLNGAPLDELYTRAAQMSGRHSSEPTPERFGECLAYKALGAGVSWADDHPDPKYKIPRVAVYADGDDSATVEGVDERFC